MRTIPTVPTVPIMRTVGTMGMKKKKKGVNTLAYKHGMYGQLLPSISGSVVQSTTVAVYVGTAPIHLVRGYREKNLVNKPVILGNWNAATSTMGYSEHWDDFTLCEAMSAHLDNPYQNAGPIYVINVFDPDKMRPGAQEKEETGTFLEEELFIKEPGLLRGTITVDGLVESEDYEIFYTEEGATLHALNEQPDPVTLHYQSAAAKNVTLQFVHGEATLKSDQVILDTLALDGLVEGVDYLLDYNYTKGEVVFTSINAANPITGNVAACLYEVDPSLITKEDIIGGKTAQGVISGLSALKLLYQELYVVPNLLVVPKWSEDPKVYNAMASASQNINGRWSAFFLADLPIQDESGNIDTKEKVILWKKSHGFQSERSKVLWPQWALSDGRVFHLSTLCAWRMLLTDSENGDIPWVSPSNKAIPTGRPYFGKASENRGYDEEENNDLNAQGITTVNQDAGQWTVWGPHTAAYAYGSEVDPRGIFEVNIRMLFYLMNGFMRRYKKEIDEPMTLGRKDSIINQEQTLLNSLQGRGILLGDPTIVFEKAENPVSDLMSGDFTWDMNVTNTPPFKSGTLRIAYTDKGFEAYYGEEE